MNANDPISIEQVREFCKENGITLIEGNECNLTPPKHIRFYLTPNIDEPLNVDYNIEPPKNFINGKKLNRKKRKK
jgi:hypothetical protein